MAQGEPDPLDEIVRAEGDGLFRFLFWSLGHREDSLDALQEVLIRVHRALPELRDPSKLRQWLYRIATNVARDVRRSRRRAPPSFGLDADEDGPSRAALIGSDEPTPLANVEARETDARMKKALADLEPELREPLLMFAVGGMKYREIAEALGWPMGTVTTRIHAARKKIAEALGG